jgi:hypothetical protein
VPQKLEQPIVIMAVGQMQTQTNRLLRSTKARYVVEGALSPLAAALDGHAFVGLECGERTILPTRPHEALSLPKPRRTSTTASSWLVSSLLTDMQVAKHLRMAAVDALLAITILSN